MYHVEINFQVSQGRGFHHWHVYDSDGWEVSRGKSTSREQAFDDGHAEIRRLTLIDIRREMAKMQSVAEGYT